MRSSRLRRSAAMGGLLAAVAACAFDTSGVDVRGSVDEATFMLSLQDYRSSGAFAEVTARSFPSLAAPAANVRVWVSTSAAAAYRAVDPAVSGSQVRLPEGALVIREVYDGAVLKRLTLMGKDAPGYYPEGGDYWFAVTDPGGTPQVEGGVVLTGRLSSCAGCHSSRAADDMLFGVPAAARVLPPPPVPPGTPPPPRPPPPPPPPIDPGPICGDFFCERGEDGDVCAVDCCENPGNSNGNDRGDGNDERRCRVGTD